MSAILAGPDFGPTAGGAPSQLIILLHGLGADGCDLIGLAPHWAELLPHAQFVAPDAPFPCDMAPMGRQWFSVEDRSTERLLEGVEAAAPILDKFIDSAIARTKLGPLKTAIVGFSQGTMMALHVALRRAEPIAAIVGFSGRLMAPGQLAADIRASPPTLLIHGDADPVVPFESLATAGDALETVGVPVQTIARPALGHAIDEHGLTCGGAFLKEHLGD
jgi:phospholipase/carboxylesterase